MNENEENKEVTQEENVVEQTPVVDDAASPTEEVVQTEVVPPVETVTTPIAYEAKPKKKGPIILIILLVLLLIVGIVLAIILLKPSDKKNDDKKVIDTPKEIKSDYRMSGNSLEAFDLYFLKLENSEKNMIYSPLSIKYALEMLAEGAKGETKSQLDAVIGDYKAKKYQNNSNMSFANAFFIRNDFKDAVRQTYIDNLTTKYGAEVKYDSFETPKAVNDWVSNKTFKLIEDLAGDISANTFVLVNALGIDMKWNYLIHCAFYEGETPVPCYNADGVYSVDYLHEKLQGDDSEYEVVSYPYMGEQDFRSLTFNGKENKKSVEIFADFNRYDAVKEIGEENIRKEVGEAYKKWLDENPDYDFDEVETDVDKYLDKYISELDSNYEKRSVSTDFKIYSDDNVKVFTKDLQQTNGITLQYVGIMPKTSTLKEFINNSSAQSIQSLIDSTYELHYDNFKDGYVTTVYGKIPLFKYDYKLNLKEDLKKLGITNIFDFSKSNLGNMLTEDGGIIIDKVEHKAAIEFSNEGIKAAAATMEGGLGNIFDGFNYLYEVPTIKIDMTFDKPYLYLIRDKDTGEAWFVGTVYDPIDK